MWVTLMWSADARQHEWEVAYPPSGRQPCQRLGGDGLGADDDAHESDTRHSVQREGAWAVRHRELQPMEQHTSVRYHDIVIS